jgi:putative SOS response-associated peptidase YedK
MCGRFSQFSLPEEMAVHFGLEALPELVPEYNISPGRKAAVVRRDVTTGHRRLDRLLWGLATGSNRYATGGKRMINARSETVFSKPSFRKMARRRRALIPTDGFYEWKKNDRTRQAHFIRLKSGRPFALAGLWEQEHHQDGGLESFLIMTTQANDLVGMVHDRMPVIIKPDDYDRWLDPGIHEQGALVDLFVPLPSNLMEMWAVGTYVNKATHEGPACIEPDGGQGRLF